MSDARKEPWRLVNAYRNAIVTDRTAGPPARVRVQISDLDQVKSYWLPVAQKGALTGGNNGWWFPKVGEQVAVLMDERDEDGVVLGAIQSSADPGPPSGFTLDDIGQLIGDGAVFKYDPDAHALSVSLPASATIVIQVAGGGSITYDASGNWKIEPGAGQILLADAAGGVQPVARIGDTVTVPNIQSGSDTATGTIASGSSKVSAGG